MKQNRKILITGGSGFIGGYVLRHFRKWGLEVTNFDLLEEKRDAGSFIEGSILDFEAVQNAVNKHDIIFHFAGFSNINLVKASPRSCVELNIMGTSNFLEAIRRKGEGTFVFASSVYVHNINGHFYTTSKLASENICENYSDIYGLPIAILRLGTAYGEESRHEDVVSIFAKKAVQGEPITIHGSGEQMRHFIHGEDIATACKMLATSSEAKGTFILASKIGTSIKELAEIISGYIPSAKITYFDEQRRVDDYQGDLEMSILEKTYKTLNWHPSIDIEEGVKRLIGHFKGKL